MTTINYDLPVKDLIAGLDATGHVTHTQHRKTHVTLHHNGGILSHEGVLSVWQTRPASAHFDVDRPGAVAQYVRVNEYAWATGDTEGNQRSISIEMSNETGGPNWSVAEATWKSAGRLAGWLFARVIGTRPTEDTLVVHKYWNATDCAGPYIDRVYSQILTIARQTYDRIVSGHEIDDITRKRESVIQIVKGTDSPAHYVLEITGDGIRKSHISTEAILDLYRTMLGKVDEEGELIKAPVEVKPQWMIDTVSNGPTL